MTKTPESIKPHSLDYKAGSWKNYTIEELGQWVHLLTKRAQNRTNPTKAAKDLHDAYNYLNMMRAKVEGIQHSLGLMITQGESNEA